MARLGDENRTNVTLDQISEAGPVRGAGRGEPQLLHRPGHLLHRHRPGGVQQRDRWLDAGRLDDHPAVREERDPEELRADVHAQVPGAVPGHQAGQQLLEGPDPRELPEHHLLRPRRLRHRVGRQHLLRRAGRPAHRRSRARCWPSWSAAPRATTPRSAPQDAQDRWGKVLDAMVDEGWLTSDGAGRLGLPAGAAEDRLHARPPRRARGPDRHAGQERADEQVRLHRAADRRRWPADHDDDQQGLRRTPPSPPSPTSWRASPTTLRQALVSVDPKTGGVLAYYGGANGTRLRLRAGASGSPARR